MNRVVVTGMGALTANAHGLVDFKNALQEMKSGIRFIPKLKELGFACQVAGVPQDIDALKSTYFTQESLLGMNLSILYASIAALDCWKDAGMPAPSDPTSKDSEPDWNTGAIIGTGIGGVDTLSEWVFPMINDGKVRRLGSTSVERTMCSGPSAKIGGLLGLGGQVTTNSSACATGTEAIADSFHAIREGRAERMLAGGTEAASHYIWGCFDAMRVLSSAYNDTPEKASRPMSATAKGFVPSSGAGVLMLERLDVAQKRGARIYAEILGAVSNSGGHRGGGSMTAPNRAGVIRAIRAAVKMADIAPSDIDLISGHLTATMADTMEVKNWETALELAPKTLPWINSTKSLIGHSLGATGAIESIAGILQLTHGFIHGSANCEDLHPELAPYAERIAHKSFSSTPKILAKASFGFGDVNTCLILKKWEA